MSIPMVDLKQQYQQLRSEIETVVKQTLADAHYILGPNVQAFEQEAATYLGTKYALGVASGTDALHLALLACNIKPGDEIITPSFTFIATLEAILYCQATPVFIDIDPDTFNLDITQIEALITEKTRAIMPVHLYGNPVDMTQIMNIAKKYQLHVIEDAAQSFGATWQGQQTGSFGSCGCYSFYPSKNLAAYGDGGLITTNSDQLYQDLIALRNHGSYTRYHHEKLGYNSRLDELQAAILRVKLKYIDPFNQHRYTAAQYYSKKLRHIVKTPQENADSLPIYHQYTLLHEKRDQIQTALQQADIASAIYYPIPLHQQPLLSARYSTLDLPITSHVSAQCLSLPIFPELTNQQIDTICNTIQQAIK